MKKLYFTLFVFSLVATNSYASAEKIAPRDVLFFKMTQVCDFDQSEFGMDYDFECGRKTYANAAIVKAEIVFHVQADSLNPVCNEYAVGDPPSIVGKSAIHAPQDQANFIATYSADTIEIANIAEGFRKADQMFNRKYKTGFACLGLSREHYVTVKLHLTGAGEVQSAKLVIRASDTAGLIDIYQMYGRSGLHLTSQNPENVHITSAMGGLVNRP